MSEENKVLARRVADDIVNPGNVDAVDEIYAPDYVLHDPSTPEDVHGVEGIREFYETVFNAFPDTEISIEELIAEGDKVVTRWTSRGTHQGEFMGLPPSGKRVEVAGVTISRIEGGKIVEDWEFTDALGMMQQLGAIRAPGQSEEAPPPSRPA
jgi:steroid delta-isomerase-like uncharacterized protein